MEEKIIADSEITESEKIESIADQTKLISPAQMVLKRFFRSKLSVVGLSIIIFLFAFSFLGPLLRFTALPVYDENQLFDADGYTEVALHGEYKTPDGETFEYYYVTYSENKSAKSVAPTLRNIFGTDDKSYDVFSRLMYGGRVSLTIGFIVVFLTTFIGIILGGLAGYFGKWVDQIIMRLVDLFTCIPTLPIMLIAGGMIEVAGVPDTQRLYLLMLILTIFGWAGSARLVRGQILLLREQEYMLAAQATGLPAARKIFKHLVPNVMPQLIVSMTLGLGGIILTEATLSFLGIGLPSGSASWGSMISALKDFHILQNKFFIWGPPGVCIMLAILAFNFIGDGLRDAFDPKMKR